MSSGTRSQRETAYERLQRKPARFKPLTQYGSSLKLAGSGILAENFIGSEEEADQVEASIMTLLPPPQTLFTHEFLRQPLFLVSVVKQATEFYGAL